VANPTALSVAASNTNVSLAYDVAISGDYAYVVSGGSGGPFVVDISNPEDPIKVAEYVTTGDARDISIAGNYAYVAYGTDGGLQVVDITTPAAPSYAGSCGTLVDPWAVAVAGDYAFVADNTAGLQVLDISDPAAPALAGSYDTPGSAFGVTVSGNYAYVADFAAGLQVIDISDPSTPTLAGSYNTPGEAKGITISGNYAYVADGTSGLQVLDISDPTAPVSVGSHDTPVSASGVTISGDYAFVGDYTGGLHAFDIRDPQNPVLLDTYVPPNRVHHAAVAGDYVFACAYGDGLVVLEAFQRQYDTESNVAYSNEISGSDRTISSARLSATYSDSISWEVSADSGSNWQELIPGGDWVVFAHPGDDLLWRSTHAYTGLGVDAICWTLEIEWLDEMPVIESVADVPNDQGKQVSLSWSRSGFDLAGSATPIVEYSVFRRIDYESSTPGFKGPAGQPLYPPGDWHYVMTVPAYAEEDYSVVVPTLADSTISGGMVHTVFFVRAGTATPSVYFDSYPDSGYSVDNLAPAPPPGLTMSSPTDLAWEESEATDFDYFTAYGSSNPDLDSTAVLIGYTVATTMDVTGETYDYYHVTATDFSGNEGEASNVENSYAGVPQDEKLPISFALRQSTPNPFTVSTSIRFDLPGPSQVSLKIYDAEGRLVRTLADGPVEPGYHSVDWAGDDVGGNPLGPGLYFVKFHADDFRATNKILLLR
jgi:hypothetical protein